MKTLLAALLLTAMAAAQTTITVSRATAPLSGSPSAAAPSSSSSGSNSSAGTSAAVPAASSSGESFAEIPGSKKTKSALVVPQSLQDNSGDAAPGLNADVKQQTNTNKPSGLHFENLVDGTDPVSVTVRRFQLFCNTHSMAQDEIEVRNWVKANQNIVASTPSEMQRKQEFPLIREQLIGMKFPKEWFEVQASASAAAK